MDPKVRIYDEGDVQELGIGEFVKLHGYGIRPLIEQEAYLAEDALTNAVSRREDVVERALEEDVFAAKVYVPGWFVNNDDELIEEHGKHHPGATLKLEGLVEDYSDAAFRVVATRMDELPELVYEYEWTFLPKSVVRLVRLVNVDSIETADRVNKVMSEIRRREDEAWDSMTWDEKLEYVGE